MQNQDKIYIPNYDKSIVNLSASIQKRFGLNSNHKSLEIVDKYLLEDKDNVIILLYDGLGVDVVNKILPENSFFVKNMKETLSSVFPPTTVAATTSIMSGLYPYEHGWIGWDIYFKDIDKIVTVFKNYEKDKENKVFDYNVANKYLSYHKIVDVINERTDYQAFELFPFGKDKYENLDDMFNQIVNLTKKEGKKYIYAYCNEPDHTLHHNGILGEKTKKKVEEISRKTEEFVKKIQDYTLIIVADHGHYDVDVITLSDYPDIISLLDRNTSTEGRACSFWVKKGKAKEFEETFNKYWGKEFMLFSKEEVLRNNFFGYGCENKNLKDSIGDYMAIAISDKYFEYYYYEDDMKTQHAGLTKEEMEVPLIVVSD